MTSVISPFERKNDRNSVNTDLTVIAYFWIKTLQVQKTNAIIKTSQIVICGNQTIPPRDASVRMSAGPEITIKMTNADSRSATVALLDLSKDKPSDLAMTIDTNHHQSLKVKIGSMQY